MLKKEGGWGVTTVKKQSNSFQKGKEIGRNTFKLEYHFPKGFS